MTSSAAPSPEAPKKSTFVTVIAWIFLVCSGFATLISILQNIIVRTMMPSGVMNQAMQDTTFAKVAPKGMQFMFSHLQDILLLILIACVVTLVASIGLLRRQNWARIAFIALMSAGIFYNIASLIFRSHFMPSMPNFSQSAQGDSTFHETAARLDQMMQTIRIMTVVFTVAFTALYAWIIVKLNSTSIRQEFGA